MTRLNIPRLNKLARHLEKLRNTKTRRFDFSVVVDYFDGKRCGCAIGELPRVFPRAFEETRTTIISRQTQDSGSRLLRDFFGLFDVEAMHLFYPGNQATDVYGGKPLDFDATAKQVAANIRAFVKWYRGISPSLESVL